MNVLNSNLIPDGVGALSVINDYTNPDPVTRELPTENEDGTYTIPTYERQVIDIPDDFDWSQYGKFGPTLRYFNRVRTGEITYNPADDEVDEDLIAELTEQTGMTPDEILKAQMKGEAIAVGTQLAAGVGGQIGRSVAAAGGLDNFSEGVSKFTSEFKPMDIFRAPTGDGVASKVKFSPTSDNAELAKFDAVINKKAVTQTDLAMQNQAKADKKAFLANVDTGPTGYYEGLKDRLNSGLFDKSASAAGKANLYGSAGAGMGTIAANLIAGKNLKESVKAGVKVGAGTYIGTAIGGPIGGIIGGLFGGRVICNELMRQGIMTRKQVVLDYKFTEDYLTPQHVAGYHVWAVWMVRQMRKGRLVNFWTHVAGHRANEISYIYGKRDKPDYLGKVYRKILEPICWSIGFFCQKTDWTVLYKEKEI